MRTNSAFGEFLKSRNDSKRGPPNVSISASDPNIVGHRRRITASANSTHRSGGFEAILSERETATKTAMGTETATRRQHSGEPIHLPTDSLQVARKDTHDRVETRRFLSRVQLMWLERGERIGRVLRKAFGR